MSCDGARARRTQIVTQMATLRAALPTLLADAVTAVNSPDDFEGTVMWIFGALTVDLDRMAAAIIALAAPCCDGCDEH